jgi:hypothetical protein
MAIGLSAGILAAGPEQQWYSLPRAETTVRSGTDSARDTLASRAKPRVELVWLFAGPIAAASWPGEPGVIPEHWPMPVWVVVEPTRDSAWEPMPSPAASETRRWRTSWARASSGPLINALYSASHGLRARGRPDERSLRGKKARAPRTARVCEKPDPSFSRVSASAGCPGEMNAEADRLVGDALGRC